MTIYLVQHGNSKIEFPTQEAADNYASANSLSSPTSFERSAPDYSERDISNRIKSYQNLAQHVLTQIYTANTIAGITAEQSDAIFDDYADVILRIMQGAFPTAKTRLEAKTPSGFVTQEMLDSWIAILDYHINS